MSENFYKILGLAQSATQMDIKKAYRLLSRQYHPDKNDSPEAGEMQRKLNEAYAKLTNRNENNQPQSEDNYGSPSTSNSHGYQYNTNYTGAQQQEYNYTSFNYEDHPQKNEPKFVGEPSEIEITIAKYLIKNLPKRRISENYISHKYFYASESIDMLLNSKWSISSNSEDYLFSTRDSVIRFMDGMLKKDMFYRNTTENDDNVKLKLDKHSNQVFIDEKEIYVWDLSYDMSLCKALMILIFGGLLFLIFAVILFAIAIVLYIIALITIRPAQLITFTFVWTFTCGRVHCFLLPNFFKGDITLKWLSPKFEYEVTGWFKES